jgi:hypothetical protein
MTDVYKDADIFAEDDADPDVMANLGPLTPLAGIWEGDEGFDVAPGPDGAEESRFRERIVFEPMGPVQNGPQTIYGLRYSTMAWRLGEEDAFHEEEGYWLWDPKQGQVMRSFIVPRGVTVNAGGNAGPEDKTFSMAAESGSEVYGVTSNPFLERAKRTIRFELTVTIQADGRFSYDEDTQIRIEGQEEIFHHTDRNTLSKVAD